MTDPGKDNRKFKNAPLTMPVNTLLFPSDYFSDNMMQSWKTDNSMLFYFHTINGSAKNGSHSIIKFLRRRMPSTAAG